MKQRFFMPLLALLLTIPLLGWSTSGQEKKIVISGDVSGPWLGVQIEKISPKMLKNLGLENGVLVNRVIKGSPAEKAGLEDDDILLTFNGEKLEDPDGLVASVKSLAVDQKVKLEYFRAGKKSTTTALLAKRTDEPMVWNIKEHPGRALMPVMEKKAWLGVRSEDLNDQLRQFFGVKDESGVLVKEVIKESPAEKSGLKAGDVIIKVADRNIKSSRDLVRTINYYNPDEEIEITVVRDKKEKSLKAKLGETSGKNAFFFSGDGMENVKEPMVQDFNVDIPEIEIPAEIEMDLKAVDEVSGPGETKKIKKVIIREGGDEI